MTDRRAKATLGSECNANVGKIDEIESLSHLWSEFLRHSDGAQSFSECSSKRRFRVQHTRMQSCVEYEWWSTNALLDLAFQQFLVKWNIAGKKFRRNLCCSSNSEDVFFVAKSQGNPGGISKGSGYKAMVRDDTSESNINAKENIDTKDNIDTKGNIDSSCNNKCGFKGKRDSNYYSKDFTASAHWHTTVNRESNRLEWSTKFNVFNMLNVQAYVSDHSWHQFTSKIP